VITFGYKGVEEAEEIIMRGHTRTLETMAEFRRNDYGDRPKP
jgi:hypothetical protein